jgi:hypothetical protein
VTARRQRIRRCRRALHLGRRGVDRGAAAFAVEDAAELAQRRNGIGEEEERDQTRQRRELPVAERELFSGTVDDRNVAAGGLAR